MVGRRASRGAEHKSSQKGQSQRVRKGSFIGDRQIRGSIDQAGRRAQRRAASHRVPARRRVVRRRRLTLRRRQLQRVHLLPQLRNRAVLVIQLPLQLRQQVRRRAVRAAGAATRRHDSCHTLCMPSLPPAGGAAKRERRGWGCSRQKHACRWRAPCAGNCGTGGCLTVLHPSGCPRVGCRRVGCRRAGCLPVAAGPPGRWARPPPPHHPACRGPAGKGEREGAAAGWAAGSTGACA